jgi:signal transduction histidine kinase
MSRFLLLLLLLLGCRMPALTQDDYTIRQFSTENGLPSNGIKGIQWDESTGFLWIATEAGIVRFNGMEFKTYSRENTPGISSERMLFMVRNHEGKLFSCDQSVHILTVRENRVVYLPDLFTGSAQVKNLFLIGASQYLFQKNLAYQSSFSFIMPFLRIATLTDSTCYIQSGNKLFSYGVSRCNEMELPPLQNRINAFFKIGTECFVTDSINRMFLIDPGGKKITHLDLNDEQGGRLRFTAQGSMVYWENGMEAPILFCDDKAYLLQKETGRLKAVLVADRIPKGIFIRYAQYSNKKKLLFIGTDSKGLLVISANQVQAIRKKNSNINERNAYYGQVELSNGNVLTNEGHILGDHPNLPGSLPINGAFLYSAYRDADSLLWYVQQNEIEKKPFLQCYLYRTGETKVFRHVQPAGISTLGVSKDFLYLADEKGIGRMEGDRLRYLYYFPENQHTTCYSMAESSPSVLLVATCQGLLRFQTKTLKLDTILFTKGVCVRSIWKYRDYVFFGTYGMGYFIWKNDKISAMPLDKNKYLLYTHCFLPDGKGYVWMSTNRGLFKANLDELIASFENNDREVYYHYLGKNDGMAITEMNGGCNPCALTLKNKMLSFPTMDGLLWVDPEKAVTVLPQGKIYVDDILVNNNRVNPDSFPSYLPAQTQDLVFRLGVAAWSNKENIYVDYALNDTLNWRKLDIEKNTEIVFSNLPAGYYQLHIRKLNGFGIRNYTYLTIPFSITLPWYRQWWIYVLTGLFITGLFFLYLRLRTRQYIRAQKRLERQVSEKTKELQLKNEALEKADGIKTRLISIISHDIVTPLKFLTVAGRNLIDKKSRMPQDLQQETLEEMTNTAQELQLLSTNILNWIKYQNENRRLMKERFHLHGLVEQDFGVLRSMANQKNLQLINEVNKDRIIYQFFDPLKILIYNLISNSISFSEKGRIVVSDRQEGEDLVVSVSDQGTGMLPEQIENILSDRFIISSTNVDNRKGNGLGYLIIKDLVKMMGGSLSIESEKERGTTVKVIIPGKNGKEI